MRLRYAVFDLDGTLLDGRGRPHEGTLAALAGVRQRGLLPVLVTGRSVPGLRALATIDELLSLFDDQMLLHNGDVLLHRSTGLVQYRRSVPADAVHRLRTAGLEDLVVEREGRYLAYSRRAALAFAVAYELPRQTIRVLSREAPALDATRIFLLGGWPQTTDGTVEDTLAGLHCAAHSVEAFRAVVIHPDDTCKAQALTAHLQARFGERGLDRAIAFGDGDNDTEMLRRSRVGVAVIGSSPAAYAAASVRLDRALAEFLAEFDPAGILHAANVSSPD
ncbi:HAD family hydrolase [Micromonospora sp. NPDC049662]|uniref:HAD family hydrolase n=1 Tax=Micromonospora sp. NPDC049662 TaxID=3155397 RepID=UPI0034352E72